MQVAAAETLQRASLGSRRDKIGCVFVFPLCIRFWPRSQVLGCKDHQDQASRWHGWELECGNHFAIAVFLWFLYLVETFLEFEWCCSPLGPCHSKVRVERTDSYGRTTSSFEGQLWTLRIQSFSSSSACKMTSSSQECSNCIRILTDLECKRCAKSQSTSSMFVLWRCDGTIFYDLSHHSGSMPHSKPRDFPPERTVSSVSYNLLIQDLLRAMTPMAIKTSSLRQDCHRAKRWASQSERGRWSEYLPRVAFKLSL